MTVGIFGRLVPARAIPRAGSDYDEAFAAMCGEAPGFAEYQRRTERSLLVVEIVTDGADIRAVLYADPWLRKPASDEVLGNADTVYRR